MIIDLFFAGLALLGWWITDIWQSLNFEQQVMFFVSLFLILLWCIRTLKNAFINDEAFGEFYLSLWQASGLDYTRREAKRLYNVSRKNSELANHMAEV